MLLSDIYVFISSCLVGDSIRSCDLLQWANQCWLSRHSKWFWGNHIDPPPPMRRKWQSPPPPLSVSVSQRSDPQICPAYRWCHGIIYCCWCTTFLSIFTMRILGIGSIWHQNGCCPRNYIQSNSLPQLWTEHASIKLCWMCVSYSFARTANSQTNKRTHTYRQTHRHTEAQTYQLGLLLMRWCRCLGHTVHSVQIGAHCATSSAVCSLIPASTPSPRKPLNIFLEHPVKTKDNFLGTFRHL